MGVFACLALAYSWLTPLFEGNDERAHYRYADAIAREGAPPNLNTADSISHEASQPPLYYVLLAALIAPIDRSDFDEVFLPSPELGAVPIEALHTERENRFPPQKTALALRLARLVGVVLGSLTVLGTYGIAARLTGNHLTALVAAGLLAFNPKFLSLSGVVSNDMAVACSAAATLCLASKIVTVDRPTMWREAFLLGIMAGTTILCKLNGAAVILPVAYAIVWNAAKTSPSAGLPRRSGQARALAGRSAAHIAIMLSGVTAISGAFFMYQTLRYGDPLAVAQVEALHAFTRRDPPLDIVGMFGLIPTIFDSAWGAFGWGIGYTIQVGQLPLAVLIVGAAGTLGLALRGKLRAELSLLLVSGAATAGVYSIWARTHWATDNSRLMMPMFISVAVFTSIGLLAWFPRSRRDAGARLMLGALGCIALTAPFISLIPGYAVPAPLSAVETAALPEAAAAKFDNGIDLVSARLAKNRINSGERVQLTLYWRARTRITENYRVGLNVVTDKDETLVREDGPPLGGMLLTSQWEPGNVYRRVHDLDISAPDLTVARIILSVYRQTDRASLARAADGNTDVQIGEIKVRGTQGQAVSGDPLAEFGNRVALHAVEFNGDRISLRFQSLGNSPHNLTLFVHGFSADGRLIAQHDFPFHYPAQLWDRGDTFVESAEIRGLNAADRIRIGVYDPLDDMRLVATTASGANWPDNLVTAK